MLAVARNAQALARKYAPYQNELDVRLAPRPLWKKLLWFLFPPRPLDLKPREVTDLVNALLNAGNALESLVTRKEDTPCPQPEPPTPPPSQPPTPASPSSLRLVPK